MDINTINHTSLIEALPIVLGAGLVPIIKGSPGNAKSDIVKQYAKRNSLKVIDIRLAQMDALDLNGLPRASGNSFTHLPLNTFPIKGTKVPSKYKGWLLFFDEMLLAPPSVVNAAYKIVLDKMIGQHSLHKKVQIVCASNLATDNADVTGENSAMASRLIHFTLENLTLATWKKWALPHGIDYRVIAFVENNPEFLYKFNPEDVNDTFPCGRTWEFVSRVIKNVKELTKAHFNIINGTIGMASGMSFKAYCDFATDLPTVEEVLANPKKAKKPEDIGAIFMVISMLSSIADATNIKMVLRYLSYLDPEYQVLFFRNVTITNPNIVLEKPVKEWIEVNKEILT